MPTSKTILIIATLDTKRDEAVYLRQSIQGRGMKGLILDTGMHGDSDEGAADIRREEVARAADCTYARVQEMPRLGAEEIMAAGVAKLVGNLYTQRKIDAVIGVGGYDGTLLATAGMRALPFGVPKLMVSSMACGGLPFGDYVGIKDVMVLPSVVDFLGTNELVRKVLDNAAGAIVGMAEAGVEPEVVSGNLVAVTMYGQTTPAAMAAKPLLDAAGLALVPFHPNGVGGEAMEAFVRQRVFEAVWDLTTQELSDRHVMDRPSGGAGRLETAGRLGIPQVVVPGCVDFVWGTPEAMHRRFPQRLTYQFNPRVLLVKLTPEEVTAVAESMAEKLNRAQGPVTLALPLQGVSMFDGQGGPLHQPEVNEALYRALHARIDDQVVDVVEVDAHVNDSLFAEICAERLISLIDRRRKTTTH